MFNRIDQELQRVQRLRMPNPDDGQLLDIEATLLLAQQVEKLAQAITDVTVASDFIPGGRALRVVQGDK